MNEKKGIPEDLRPTCRLVGEDGNAFAIMGRVTSVLRRAGFENKIKEYHEEAMSGDYDHLLGTTLKYVKEEVD